MVKIVVILAIACTALVGVVAYMAAKDGVCKSDIASLSKEHSSLSKEHAELLEVSRSSGSKLDRLEARLAELEKNVEANGRIAAAALNGIEQVGHAVNSILEIARRPPTPDR